MHRIILERIIGRKLEKGEECDHIDSNSLNNRRNNLRLVVHRQNLQNKVKQSGYSINNNYKGIYFDSHSGKWKAQITVNGRNYNLGRYATDEEAARVYDAAAKKYFGEYAKTNGLDDTIKVPELSRSRKSKTGYTGVYKSGQKWQAQIRRHGKIISLGYYKTPEEAFEVFKKKREEFSFRDS